MAVRFTRASSQYWSRTSGALLDYNADYTFMAWCYLTSDVNGYYSLLGIYGSADTRADVLQTASDGTTLNVYCTNTEGITYTIDVNGGTLPIGQWIHLTLSRERKAVSDSLVRAYINGAQNIVSAHNLTDRTISSRMYVGAWFGSSDYANGRVAQVKAFQRVLTPEQIRAEMESAEPVNRSALWGWWPAWERGAGLRNRDWSGNGYDWTETATPTDEDDPAINFSLFLLPAFSDGAAEPIPITGTESGSFSESSALTVTLPGSDSGVLSETVTIAAALSGSDSGTLSESSELSTAEQLTGSENGTLTESVSLAVVATASDSGTETESGALVVIVAGSDAGTFAEASSLDTVTQIAGTDSGTLDDAASLAATAAASDSGTFSESGSVGSFSSDHQISVGHGYTDVTPSQLARTSDNRLWIASWEFDHYPKGTDSGLGQTLRMYKADQIGTPSAFTRMDSSHEPADVNSWSIAVGASDVIHVVWTKRASWGSGAPYLEDGTDNYIYYCQFNTVTGLWGTAETIESAAAITEMGQGDDLCAIAVDVNGDPHIVYLKSDGTRRRVNYRNKIGGSWSSATTVDDQSFTGDQRCWHPGIRFDQDGRIVVTWLRGNHTTSDDGRIFIRVYSGGSWGTTHDVVGANVFTGIDNGTPIYIDSSNRYHICYITTSATKYIQYRYSDDEGATWTANHPASGTYVGDDPTPGPGANGKVRIYAHGLSGDNYPIVYWEGDGGSASWGSVTTYSSGATPNDCSVNVRWCRYYYWYPGSLDIAYWKSTYPTNELYIGMDLAATDFYSTDSGTETESGALAATVAGSDAGAETETSALAAALAANDSGTFTESSELISGMLINGVESGTFAEVSSLTVVISATEACTFSEDSAIAAVLAGSDSGTFAEASDLATGMLIAGTENGTFTELSSLAVAVPGTEAWTCSEAVVIDAVLSASDSGLFGEVSYLVGGRGYVTLTEALSSSVTIDETAAAVIASDGI